MRGTFILVAFFSLFTVACLLIPSPMFPGYFLIGVIGDMGFRYSQYLSAVLNGVFYGIILWVIFVAFSRRLEQD